MPRSKPENETAEDTPLIGEMGAVAASGAGATPGGRMRECDEPVFLRVRNASDLRFDSATINEIDFGSVPARKQSKYRRASGCVYSYGQTIVTSGKQRFIVFPIDYVGEIPLEPGYYTQALTPLPSGDLHQEISKDPQPK